MQEPGKAKEIVSVDEVPSGSWRHTPSIEIISKYPGYRSRRPRRISRPAPAFRSLDFDDTPDCTANAIESFSVLKSLYLGRSVSRNPTPEICDREYQSVLSGIRLSTDIATYRGSAMIDDIVDDLWKRKCVKKIFFEACCNKLRIKRARILTPKGRIKHRSPQSKRTSWPVSTDFW